MDGLIQAYGGPISAGIFGEYTKAVGWCASVQKSRREVETHSILSALLRDILRATFALFNCKLVRDHRKIPTFWILAPLKPDARRSPEPLSTIRNEELGNSLALRPFFALRRRLSNSKA